MDSPHTRENFSVAHCIEFDVSRQSLELWDETRDDEVPPGRGLDTLKKPLKKRCGTRLEHKGRFVHEPTGPDSNYLREFAAEHGVRVREVNPKKSANFAKVLEKRSRTDTIDTKTSYAFHALLTEEDFRILEIDEIPEQLGARLGSYEITQKTRTMFSNHVRSLEHKGELAPSYSLEKELKHLGTMEEQLEKAMERYAEDHQETREGLQNLLSMKGIGAVSAMSLRHLSRQHLGAQHPGTNRNGIIALAGLDPAQK